MFSSFASSDSPSSNSTFPFITSFIKSFHTKLKVPTHTLLLSIVDNLLVYVGVICAFPVKPSIIFIVAYTPPASKTLMHNIIIITFETLFISSNPFIIKIFRSSFLPLWIRFFIFWIDSPSICAVSWYVSSSILAKYIAFLYLSSNIFIAVIIACFSSFFVIISATSCSILIFSFTIYFSFISVLLFSIFIWLYALLLATKYI